MATDNSTTYCIYRIVCFPTGKCYVGQTNNVSKRSRTHFAKLRSNKHHCKKLQYAYNKYGRGAFYFEVLEQGLLKQNANEAERKWIDVFDSYKMGFNHTPGGDAASNEFLNKPCEWNSVGYKSISDAGAANHITTHAMLHRLQMGYKCDADMPYNRPCTWNGITYSTISDAARVLGINIATLGYRLRRGYTKDGDIKTSGNSNRRVCYWNGIEYESVAECARVLGISLSSLRERFINGYACDADLIPHESRHATPCIWNGVNYISISAAARDCGISYVSMLKRLNKGYSCDDDMVRGKNK